MAIPGATTVVRFVTTGQIDEPRIKSYYQGRHGSAPVKTIKSTVWPAICRRGGAGGSIPQVADTYDPQGRLQTEANAATGALFREYIWLDDQLIAMAIPGATTVVRYVTTGQIDEPLIMTAANKSLSWNDYLDPFGVAGAISGSASELNLRYPGQWYQSESSNAGLNQNGQREYDPTLGRYTQPDPLGIDAGANVYAYVGGDLSCCRFG
jgi:RHS repeat-associated protein